MKGREASLDYILVHQRWLKSCRDVFSYQYRFKTSDHRMIGVVFTMKFVSAVKKVSSISIDRELLKNVDVVNSIEREVQVAMFVNSVEDVDSTERLWQKTKLAVQEAMYKNLKKTKSVAQSISSEETQQKWLAGEDGKKSFDADYEKKWDALGDEMQQAADEGDQREVFKIMKSAIGTVSRKRPADEEEFAKKIKEKCRGRHAAYLLIRLQICFQSKNRL